MPTPSTILTTAVLAAACVLGPAAAADEPSPYDRASRSPALAMIDDAVEATKHDETAVAFIVALPDDATLAGRAIDAWSRAASNIPKGTPVLFVQGTDRDEVLEKSAITQTPAYIAYRSGLPLHARTACADPASIRAFIDIALDDDAPPTYSTDQTRILYDDMMTDYDDGMNRTATEHGCMLLMTIHALTEGPYSNSFAACETAQMHTMYNTATLRVAHAARTSPTAAALIAQAARTAKRTFDANNYDDLGIALFMDLAPSAGMSEELLAFVDSHTTNPRAARALKDHGQRIAPLLIDAQRWSALARSYTSPDQITQSLDRADAFARAAVEDGIAPRAFIKSHRDDMTRVLALTHAALIEQGRHDDAWDVASIITLHAGEQPAAVAILESALELGVSTPQHDALAAALNPAEHQDLLNRLPTTAISAETDLVED